MSLEKYLIVHCAPTLASLKTASLFSLRYSSKRELEEQLVLPRHALHACRLEFPFDEETFTAEAPLPEDMRRLLETGD